MITQDKYEEYARKVAIFGGLTPEEVEYILHCGKIVHFRAGQTVFYQGQMGSNLFICLKGSIGLYDQSKLIATMHVGDAFGEMAVLNKKPRTATAAAIEDARLFSLDESEINEILEKQVAVRLLMNIIHLLSERLEESNRIIAKMRKPE